MESVAAMPITDEDISDALWDYLLRQGRDPERYDDGWQELCEQIRWNVERNDCETVEQALRIVFGGWRQRRHAS